MTPDEEWRPVVGYEGYYEVSSLGRVRSLDRTVDLFRGFTRNAPGRLLKQTTPDPYHRISLKVRGNSRTFMVHRLVAEAFIGPRPHKYDICHNNGEHTDNRAANLRYDTRSANNLDIAKHHGRQSHCKWGHELAGDNVVLHAHGRWRCRTCETARQLRRIKHKKG